MAPCERRRTLRNGWKRTRLPSARSFGEQVRAERLFEDVWPAYNLHGNYSRYLASLFPNHAHLQVIFVPVNSRTRYGDVPRSGTRHRLER